MAENMMTDSLAVTTRGLTKAYTSYRKAPGLWASVKSLISRETLVKEALKPLDLDIREGEIVGLLGANGAGKTTLMKMLSGIIVPSGGEARVFGEIPWRRRNSFKQRIALAMGQKNQLQWDLPALDSFQLIREYYGIDHQTFKRRLSELTELLDVADVLDIQVRRLSLGERMKVEIMASLMHGPSLIMLDEPTIGLDVNAQERLRQFFRDYHEEHRPTILLTSHYMVDITALCPRVVLLADGVKIYDGERERLTAVLGQKKRLHLIFHRDQTPPRDHAELTAWSPRWTSDNEVILDIDRNRYRDVTARLLGQLPVADFATDEVPFEAVMEKVLAHPELLESAL